VFVSFYVQCPSIIKYYQTISYNFFWTFLQQSYRLNYPRRIDNDARYLISFMRLVFSSFILFLGRFIIHRITNQNLFYLSLIVLIIAIILEGDLGIYEGSYLWLVADRFKLVFFWMFEQIVFLFCWGLFCMMKIVIELYECFSIAINIFRFLIDQVFLDPLVSKPL